MSQNTSGEKHDYAKNGDYIVPSYSENGTPRSPGIAQGTSEDMERLRQKMIRHATASGGVALTAQAAPVVEAPKKRGRKKAVVQTQAAPVVQPTIMVSQPAVMPAPIVYSQPAVPSTPVRIPAIDVVFANRFGKMTLKAIQCLEHEDALCLVFENEDKLTFIPAQGEELTVTIDKTFEHKILYPGYIFTWPDDKKLMVLVKLPDNYEPQ